jgi:hypothetical protein
MKKYLKVGLFGLISWAVPFIVSLLISPLRESQRPLFESIMPVVVTICAVILSILYFSNLESGFLLDGVLLGVAWLIINLALDRVLFSQGPMKMSLADYLKDIGVTYLIIPIVTLGYGYIVNRRGA